MKWYSKVSHHQKWGEKNSKNCHIPIFGFQFVATNIEGWLNKLYSIADL